MTNRERLYIRGECNILDERLKFLDLDKIDMVYDYTIKKNYQSA